MKNWITLFLLVGVPLFCFAQVDTKDKEVLLNTSPSEAYKEKEEVTIVENDKSLLWEISGNGLEKPSYLYGTIHIIGKDDFFMTDNTRASFKDSERVVFEINMEEMNDFSVIFTLMGKVMMNGGVTLPDLLTKEDYQLVEEKFEALGLPMMMLNRMKPMFLSVFASGDIDPNSMSNGDMKSYEMEFMQMAQKAEKEMAGLETIEFQLSMFDSIPYKAQADMLVEALKADSSGDDEFEEMVKMYKDQDIEAMVNMIDEGEGGVGGYGDLLLVNRNKNWIPIMANMMTSKSTFFAVGAGHLGGKNGVVQLLRNEGYTLRSLK